MAAAPVMTIKTFLPMGEKPPDIIGQGNNATIKQAPTVISFPPSQQFPEEFLVLELLTLCSIAFSLIVIILSPVSLASNFALVPPMHYPTTYPHWNPTTIITSSNTTTTITTINTTTIITVNAPKTHAIDIIPDSSAHPVNILSFTSATVATAPTTAAPATAEIYLHSTSLFIVVHFAASNITSCATAADYFSFVTYLSILDSKQRAIAVTGSPLAILAVAVSRSQWHTQYRLLA